ncbi:MAG: hypothetical protein LBK58_04770 [Prevotellaceae bacterium]|jgi:peptidoglycan hydrolase CwlO-like protein|nr:hypothetical protein [Prevotellaceae bacterium]
MEKLLEAYKTVNDKLNEAGAKVETLCKTLKEIEQDIMVLQFDIENENMKISR